MEIYILECGIDTQSLLIQFTKAIALLTLTTVKSK